MTTGIGAVLVVFGGVLWRWGRTRAVVLDDRGEGWIAAYVLAQRLGPAIAGIGAVVAAGGAFAS